jgi:DNA-binding HxlR family transcriptional regulator
MGRKTSSGGQDIYPNSYILAMKETLTVLGGKWKVPIIAALLHDHKRFNDIQKFVGNITPRMLSKELKEFELNGILTRNVHNTTPVLIEYEISDSGKRLKPLLEAMLEWGIEHRKTSFKVFEN